MIGPIPPAEIRRICADHQMTICATHENGAVIVDEQAIQDAGDVDRVLDGAIKVGAEPVDTVFNRELADLHHRRVADRLEDLDARAAKIKDFTADFRQELGELHRALEIAGLPDDRRQHPRQPADQGVDGAVAVGEDRRPLEVAGRNHDLVLLARIDKGRDVAMPTHRLRARQCGS